MIAFLRFILGKARLCLMRQQRLDSVPLRGHFGTRHEVEVRLHSCGYLDEWRFPGPMRVGRYCSIAIARAVQVNHSMIALTAHQALYEWRCGAVDEDLARDVRPVIEGAVWIGHNAIILPGCKFIGRDSVVDAGATVAKDVSACTVVAGNWARKLRDRFEPDLIATIETSHWWETDLVQLCALIAERREMIFVPTS